MKKIVLSLILALVLSLPICVVSYAETEYSEELEYKVDTLEALGILNEDGKSDYSVFRDMSKSSFINFICNICGDYGYTVEYSEEAIRTAEDMGIIHKNQDDLYKPLNYNEAMTMLVRLLGYGVHAEQTGGYPDGYIAIASRLGLTEDLRPYNGGALQEYDAVTLLYNAINSSYVDIVKITSDGIEYGGASDRTLLYEFRRIYRVDGIMQSDGMASIDTNIPADAGKVIINGYTFKSDENFSQNLGLRVEAYVQEEDSFDRVLFMKPRYNSEVIVPADKIVGMSSDCRTFTYYNDKGKEIKAHIASVPAVIYNGQAKSYSPADFSPDDGQVTLINNDSGNEYDTILITDYKTMVVDSVSKFALTVRNIFTYDASNLTLNLEPKIEDVINIYYEDSEIEVKDILPGDVLRVSESTLNGRRFVQVYVSREKISGVFTSHTTNGDMTYLTIDDDQYLLSKTFIKAENATPTRDQAAEVLTLGNRYTFYLDNAGAIVFAKLIDDNNHYAILKDTASMGTINRQEKVRAFTNEGEWMEYTLAKKVDYTDATGATNRYTSQEALNQLATDKLSNDILVFSYTLNADGQIRTIQIPKRLADINAVNAVDGDNEFNYYASGESIKYLGGTASFGMDVYIDDIATVWFVDTTNIDNEKSYTLQNISELGTDNGNAYTYRAYNLDRFAFTNMVVIESGQNPYSQMKSTNTDLFVVEDIRIVRDDELESRTVITGMMGSYDLISFYCDEDVTLRRNGRTTTVEDTSAILSAGVRGLRKGDVVTIHTNSQGYVDAVELRYVRGTTTEYFQTAADEDTDTDGTNRLQEMPKRNSVTDMKFHGRVSLVNNSSNRMQAFCDGQKMNFKTAANTLVAVYDMKKDTLRRGTINDIEIGDFVVIRMNQFKISTIVVYKNLP